MSQAYQDLLKKIDSFSRKFYVNQIIRGSLYFVGIFLGALLLSIILEYFGRFSTQVRTFLFYGLLAVFVYLLIRYIAIPALRLLKLGRRISHEDASNMIGKHFPDVSDKLLNTLQLRGQAEKQESALLMASIDQRIEELKPVNFVAAVDFSENKKYLKYVIPPIALGLILFFFAPNIIQDGSKRLVTYNVEYIPEAPFDFLIQNKALEVPLNEDFTVKVQTEGEYKPGVLSIEMDGKLFRMKKTSEGFFTYTFRNVRNSLPFKLFADGFYSDLQTLEVLPTPSVVNFNVALSYPSYLGKKNEELNNTGNFEIPEGTRVQWEFKTQNSESLFIQFPDSSATLSNEGEQNYSFQKKILNTSTYAVAASNSIVGSKDTLNYQINVIKDSYPRIILEEVRDSLDEKQRYFGGTISDDHGLRALAFKFVITGAEGETKTGREDISIGGQTVQEFYYSKDFRELDIQPGDRLDYYFEVWDNDGVNGSKSTTSDRMSYEAPSLEELDDQRKESSENVKEKLEKSIEDAAELQKELQELNKELLQKDEFNWQDKKRIEDVLNKQKQIENQINELNQERQESLKNQEEYMQQSEEILQKQEQIQKMFEELMSEEMKELYKKLEEMMKELNQEQIKDELENMELSSEELEKELDRTLELFKQLEFEQEFDETVNKLEELAKEQKELSEESKDSDKDSEELKEKQEELNDKFEQVKDDINALEKMNEELEDPNEMPDTESLEESIDEQMENASDDLEKNKKKKASESQQGASEQMEQMANQMSQSMESQQAESLQENMEDLRALLENIIQLSFDQEEIMESLRVIERDDPRYVELGQRQKKLEDDSKMVEDSLFALSKRIAQIQSIVNEEIGKINNNISKAIADIGERMTANATTRQQYVMTSYNNLALLLDEALQQMQMQMANQMPGKGNCENPGGQGSGKSGDKMSKLQDQMGKKLEEMKKSMEKGKQDGGRKPGMGKQGMSKDIAKMAAEQAAIRREIEKMAQKLNEQGKGEGKGLEEIAEQMEENEKDLVNEELTRETLMRQQDILTRLLESEKAEREREYDNKRESNSPNSYEKSNPEEYLEYNRRKAREVELLRTVPPDLKPYYKDRVNDYFLNFEN